MQHFEIQITNEQLWIVVDTMLTPEDAHLDFAEEWCDFLASRDGLGRQLLARCLASCRFTSGLFGPCHCLSCL